MSVLDNSSTRALIGLCVRVWFVITFMNFTGENATRKNPTIDSTRSYSLLSEIFFPVGHHCPTDGVHGIARKLSPARKRRRLLLEIVIRRSSIIRRYGCG